MDSATREKLIDAARISSAQVDALIPSIDALVAAERERCAGKADHAVKVARENAATCPSWSPVQGEWFRARDTGLDIADAIRAKED